MTRTLLPSKPRKTTPRLSLWPLCLMFVLACPVAASSRSEPPTVIEVSELDRQRCLEQAGVFTDRNTSELDLKTGPVEGLPFDPSREVTCVYETPGIQLGGATPKFLCRIGSEVFKAKYLPSEQYGTAQVRGQSGDREIYAELAATRLFWALGFGADKVFLVRLRCNGCPAIPHDGPNEHERRTGRYRESKRPLGIALIERRFEGATIEEGSDDGWTWSELDSSVGRRAPVTDSVSPTTSGSWEPARREHVEALQLLQVFVQHGDCKPEQQRLVCLPGGVVRHKEARHPSDDQDNEDDEDNEDEDDKRGQYSCRLSYALVDDLGLTFGGAGAFTGSSAKMSLKHWAKKAVFDMDYYRETGGVCRGVLDTSMACSGGIENPIITEAGRRFLLDRLSLLSDGQIRDLFVAARVTDLCDDPEECGVDAWVATFKDKVRQIAAQPCRAPSPMQSRR